MVAAMTTSACRLPPGSLGLELSSCHRSLGGKMEQKGLKIKRWKACDERRRRGEEEEKKRRIRIRECEDDCRM